MDGSAPFEAAIDEAIENGQVPTAQRLVYADWLDEQGDNWLATAQRWMARYGRWPLPERDSDEPIIWGWYSWRPRLARGVLASRQSLLVDRSKLPLWIVKRLPNVTEVVSPYRTHRGFYSAEHVSRPEAERALAGVLALKNRVAHS